MSTHLRFQKPAIDQVGLAGFFTFYRTNTGQWFREPINKKQFFLNESPKAGNSLVIQPGLVHKRMRLP
eukprot:UN07351